MSPKAERHASLLSGKRATSMRHAGAPDKVRIEATRDVADLRKEIKAALQLKDVDAVDVRLSTADGRTYNDPRALVSTLPLDKEFIVTVASAEKKRRVGDDIAEQGAGDPVYDLWRALKTVTPVGQDVGSGVLCFDIPGNLWITGEEPLRLPLFIREDVRRVWELALQPFLKNVVVTGTPGIGKTVGVFNWALISLSKSGHRDPVVLDLMKSRTRYVLWPDGRVQRHNGQAGRWLPDELNKSSTILLSDPREDGGGAPDLVAAKHIVVSPPSRSNYEALLKAVRAGADVQPTARLYVYPWTREEVRVFWTRLDKDVSTALQAFDIAGGSMRLIAQGPAVAKKQVVGAIDPSDVNGAAAVYRTFADYLSAERGELLHRLFHGFPPASATERYREVHPDFCSPFAVAAFAKALAEAKGASAHELLGVLRPTPSLRGTIFESLLLERFAHRQQLQVFETQRDNTLAGRLATAKAKPFDFTVLEPPEVRRDLADPLVEVRRALQERKTRLLVPRAENYAAVDCFLVCLFDGEWRVVALQMTVAPSHSYLPDRLAEYHAAAGRAPFVYCVVCLAKHRMNMALPMAEGALQRNKASRKVVEQDGVWLLPFH